MKNQKIYNDPELSRLHNAYVGRRVTRIANAINGAMRQGIVTDVIERDYDNNLYFVILWDDDHDIRFDEEGYEFVYNDFNPISNIIVDKVLNSQFFTVEI